MKRMMLLFSLSLIIGGTANAASLRCDGNGQAWHVEPLGPDALGNTGGELLSTAGGCAGGPWEFELSVSPGPLDVLEGDEGEAVDEVISILSKRPAFKRSDYTIVEPQDKKPVSSDGRFNDIKRVTISSSRLPEKLRKYYLSNAKYRKNTPTENRNGMWNWLNLLIGLFCGLGLGLVIRRGTR